MSSPKRHRVALAALAYTIITLAYCWPLPARLMTGVIHDPYDPILNTWILWWTTKAVPLTQHWWNAPIFLPATGVLAFSEHLLGLAPIAAPLIALTGQPLFGYNVALIATYPLSALAAYFLAFTLTRRHDAAFVAGLAYGFAPYRLGQLPHIQTLTVYWTPICLAALHRYDRDRATKWVILAAAAWLMQALSSGYYMFFLAVLIGLWLLWFAAGRWTLRMFATLGAAFAVAAVVMVPVLVGYQSILRDTYGFTRSLGEIRAFSADAAGLLLASEDLLIWGWLHVIQKPESGLFPGLTIVVLAVFALADARPFAMAGGDSARLGRIRLALAVVLAVLLAATALPLIYGAWRLTIGGIRLVSIARGDKPFTLAVVTAVILLLSWPRVRAAAGRRSLLGFYLLAAMAMWAFALGPDPTIMDQRFIYQAPYGQLMRLPGFDGLRVPARFWTMALACLSVVAGLAVNRLPPASRRTLVALAAAGLLLDGWPRRFIVLPAPSLRPSPAGVSARLDLPMTEDIDIQAIYRQMFDGVPLYNGYSGYIAPHYYALQALMEERDPRILTELARRGPLGVVVDHAADADGRARKFVLAYPGAVIDHDERDWSSYRLPQSAAAPEVPEPEGAPLRIKSLRTFPSPPHAERALDGDLRTRWSGGPQTGAADATIELESPTRVGQLLIDQGVFVADFPRRLQIDVSANGTAWESVWIGDTALQAYYAAIRDPQVVSLVLPVNRDGVRFIRLRQLGFAKRDWSIAELHVRQ